MIGGSRVIAIVTARAGSKGIPGKNVRELGGKPLVAWTIECAQQTGEIDRIILSTDGSEIARVGRGLGAEILDRPPHLADDTATSVDVLRDAIARLREAGEDARYMVLLQPTSPFRRPSDIRRALQRLEQGDVDCVIAMTEAALNPHRAFHLRGGAPTPVISGAEFWRSRQELPPTYQPNGAVYAFVIDALLPEHRGLPFGRAGAILMDRSHSVDIDDEVDLAFAETLLNRGLTEDD